MSGSRLVKLAEVIKILEQLQREITFGRRTKQTTLVTDGVGSALNRLRALHDEERDQLVSALEYLGVDVPSRRDPED